MHFIGDLVVILFTTQQYAKGLRRKGDQVLQILRRCAHQPDAYCPMIFPCLLVVAKMQQNLLIFIQPQYLQIKMQRGLKENRRRFEKVFHGFVCPAQLDRFGFAAPLFDVRTARCRAVRTKRFFHRPRLELR